MLQIHQPIVKMTFFFKETNSWSSSLRCLNGFCGVKGSQIRWFRENVFKPGDSLLFCFSVMIKPWWRSLEIGSVVSCTLPQVQILKDTSGPSVWLWGCVLTGCGENVRDFKGQFAWLLGSSSPLRWLSNAVLQGPAFPLLSISLLIMCQELNNPGR